MAAASPPAQASSTAFQVAAAGLPSFITPTPYSSPQTPDQAFFNMRLQYFLPETEPLIKQTFGSTLQFDDNAFWEYPSYYSRAVSFATNLPTLAKIEYGTTTAYGQSTAQTESYFYQHVLYLTGLVPGQTYHYRIGAMGSDGAVLTSDDKVFTTPTLPSNVVRIPQDLPGQTAPYHLGTEGATYVLTTDLTVPNGGFVIDASGVTLDLGGHTVTYDNVPNPNITPSTTRSDLMYSMTATFGVRTGLWNLMNQEIVNGRLVQGANGGAGINGTGYNPIYAGATTQLEVAGVTVDYYGDNINGIDIGMGNNNIHHNVVYDRGTGIDLRDIQMRAITTYQPDPTTVTNYNSIRRCRQVGIAVGGRSIGNEVYDDSYSTNSFLLSYASNSVSENNKLFGLGYMPVGIGGGNMHDAVARNNFIYVVAYAPNQRSAEYDRLSAVAGFRPQVYPNDTVNPGPYDNNLFENNVVVGKAFPGSVGVRALWVGSDPKQHNMVVRNNTVKVETMTDDIAQHFADANYSFSCVEFQGQDATQPHPPVLFRNNKLMTNLIFIAVGSGYGVGSSGYFYDTTFEKIDHNTTFFTPFRIGFWTWSSYGVKVIDSIAGPGVDMRAPVPNVAGDTGVHLSLDFGISSTRVYTQADGTPLANTTVTWQTDGGDHGSFTTDGNGQASNEWMTTHNLHAVGDPGGTMSQVQNTTITFTVAGYDPVTKSLAGVQKTGPAIRFGPALPLDSDVVSAVINGTDYASSGATFYIPADHVFEIDITMKNTGAISWGPYTDASTKPSTLLSRGPDFNSTFGTFLISPGQDQAVAPGGTFKFHGALRAPSATGPVTMIWQLADWIIPYEQYGTVPHTDATFFGAPVTIQINVTDPTPKPADPVSDPGVVDMNDFQYIGSFQLPDVPGVPQGDNKVYFDSGVALRTVGGEKRMILGTGTYEQSLYEVAIPDHFAKTATGDFTDAPMAQWRTTFGALPVYNADSAVNGSFWYDQATGLFYWTNEGNYYPGPWPPTFPLLRAGTLTGGVLTQVQQWYQPDLGSLPAKAFWGGVTGIPQSFADKYTGGRKLGIGFGAGNYVGGALASYGPAIAATSVDVGTGGYLDLKPIMYSTMNNPAIRDGNYFSAYPFDKNPADPWTGWYGYGSGLRTGVFIDLPDKQGYVSFARLTTNRISYDWGGQIWNATSENAWYFYNLDTMGQAALGNISQESLMPSSYTTVHLPNDTPADQQQITGSAFDPDTRLLYVYTLYALNPLALYSGPVVHVYYLTQDLAYATASVTKTVGDAPFTNPLTKDDGDVVTYSSSNPSVATVSSTGEVTVLSAGTTTITANAPAKTSGPMSSYTLKVNPKVASGTAMYRIYNPSTGEHFFTSSAREVLVNVGSGAWKYEGIGWFAPASGAPVYRLAAVPGSGSAGHLFTTSTRERDAALASRNPAGQPYWKCETGVGMPACVGWFSGGSVPVFRAFYPGSGQHNYTTDSNEQRVITGKGVLGGWNDEGIGWYGVQKGNPGAPLPGV